MSTHTHPSKILTIIGWAAIIFFVVIYGIELLPKHGMPVTLQWIQGAFGQTGLTVINILIVIAFLALLPYRRPAKHIWKSHGTFIAFVIALMTEMFGWPLLAFLIAPLANNPAKTKQFFPVFGYGHARIGTAISLLGILLIAVGWRQIHQAKGLVTKGMYRYMRHPQYTGIFLFTFGWILHFPSLLIIILWPLLIGAYVWLSIREEKQIAAEFGHSYTEYCIKTKRFIPFVI